MRHIHNLLSEFANYQKLSSFGGVYVVDIELLNGLFQPKSVAVIGASATPGKIGYTVLDNLLKSKYKGGIYHVNPKSDEIPVGNASKINGCPSKVTPTVEEHDVGNLGSEK